MTLESRKMMLDRQLVSDPRAEKSAACTLAIYETLVYANSTSAAFTVTLPSVGEARGMIFHIFDSGGAAGSNNITVADFANDGGLGDTVIAKNGGSLTVLSNGRKWVILQSDLT